MRRNARTDRKIVLLDGGKKRRLNGWISHGHEFDVRSRCLDMKSARRRFFRIRTGLAAAAVLALVAPAFATPAYAPPPLDANYVPALLAGNPLNDVEGDTPGPRDIVGDATHPLLFVASNATHLY